MEFMERLLVGGGAVALGLFARSTYKDAKETRRRRESPLSFIDGMTNGEFVGVAEEIGRRTPRVQQVVVEGMTVTLHVKSNSGLSTWTAEVDFNDYGHLTGSYWLTSENANSLIPEHFADAMQSQIEMRRAAHDYKGT